MRDRTRFLFGTLTSLVMIAAALGVGTLAQSGGGESAAPASQGYRVVTYEKGFIACAVGTAAVATDNVCPHIVSPDRSQIKFPIPAGTDVAVIEMLWTPMAGITGGKTLAFSAPAYLEEAEPQKRYEGKSILTGISRSIGSGTPADSGLLVTAGAAHDSGLVLQQSFSMAVTAFVDLEIPEGYSAFAEEPAPEPPQEKPCDGDHGHEHPSGDHGHDANESHFQTTHINGLLSCPAGVGSLLPCPPAKFAVKIPAGTDVVLVEVRWTAASIVQAKTLRLDHPTTLEGQERATIEGPSPLSATIPSAGDGIPESTSLVLALAPADDVTVGLQQKVELAVTAFVNMEIPEGFSGFDETA